jgi:hypothetical protein
MRTKIHNSWIVIHDMRNFLLALLPCMDTLKGMVLIILLVFVSFVGKLVFVLFPLKSKSIVFVCFSPGKIYSTCLVACVFLLVNRDIAL